MFCYTYNPLLILSTNFFIVLCILCMGRGTCALAYVIRSSGLFVTVFRKTFSDFPKPYAEYFHLFAHKQTRKSVIREAKCAHEKKHKPCCKKYKPYILKYKAHILKQVPCIFCLSKCLKNNMVQKPPNRASARRKSAVGK